jgi:hypothetical protein
MMPTYTQLTQPERTALDAMGTLARPAAANMVRWAQLAKLIVAEHDLNTAAAADRLDAGALIPNRTGLAGAGNLTKEQYLELIADLRTIAETMGTNSKLQLAIRASGINAMIDQAPGPVSQ